MVEPSYFQYSAFFLGKQIDRLLLRIRSDVQNIFMDSFRPTNLDRVLDVGISKDEHPSSNYFEKNYPFLRALTAIGLDPLPDAVVHHPGLSLVCGDGRRLPFADRSFDFAFSHAVIEHVGHRDNQVEFLREMTRVSRKGVLLTTPNRWHPIETHTGLPLLHYLPKPVYRSLYGRLGHSRYATEESLNLLWRRALLELVSPISDEWRVSIQKIRWLGLTSNIVVLLTRTDSPI